MSDVWLKDALGNNIVLGRNYGYIAKNNRETNTTTGKVIELNDNNNKALVEVVEFASRSKHSSETFKYKHGKGKQWIETTNLFPIQDPEMGWSEAF